MNLFRKNFKRNIFKPYCAFLIAIMFTSSLHISASSKKALKMAPKGQEIFDKKMAEYPEFDEVKYKKEVKKKFKLYKEGSKVTLKTARKTLTGTFRGVTDKSILIGSKKIAKFDLSEHQIAQFDPKLNKKLKIQYIKSQKAGYNASKTMETSKLKSKLLKEYPDISLSLLKKIFKKLPNKDNVNQYAETLKQQYYDSLPLPEKMTKKKMLIKLLKDFVKKNPQYAIKGSYIISKEEIKKKKEAKLLSDKKRQERLTQRITYPKVATPVFNPDGGFIATEIKGDKIANPFVELEITSTTKDAEIHYTTNGSTPNKTSPLYTQPIKVYKALKFKAIAFHDEFNDSDVAKCKDFDAHGLYGYFFNKVNFTGKVYKKVVKNLNCNFGSDAAPFKGFIGGYFSTIFTGTLIPPKSGEYEFTITVDDAASMWLNGELLIQGMKEQSETEYKVKKKLVAGKKYSLRISFVAVTGISLITLAWQGPGIKKQIIPEQYLWRFGRDTDKLENWTKIKNGKFINRFKMPNPGAVNGNAFIDYYFPEHRARAVELLKKK